MSPRSALEVLGGIATRSALLRLCDRAAVDRALASGDLVVTARGRYALPDTDAAVRTAHALSGVLSHRSAALAWGWAQKQPPQLPEVAVPANRRLTSEQRRAVRVRRLALGPDEIDGVVTTRRRTLADCLRSLPEAEALAIADSALRAGDVTSTDLARVADSLQGPGRTQARRVAARASELAANPFESVLRHLALEAGLDARPQVALFGSEFLGRPDLVDIERRLVLEADSFTWHGGRSALRRDTRRYNTLVVHGWTVLRFAYEDVMGDPGYVRSTLEWFVAGRSELDADLSRPA